MGDVVVEGYDGTCEVERSVDSVCDVVSEIVVFGIRWSRDSVSLGEVGGVELLLLGCISMEISFNWFSRTDLDWTSTSPVQTPIIIQVEADQSQHSEIEQNFPSRHNTAIAVKPSAPSMPCRTYCSRLERREVFSDFGKLVPACKLICEQGRDVENPCRPRNPASWQASSDAEIGVQNYEHLNCRYSMKGSQEDQGKTKIEGCSLL